MKKYAAQRSMTRLSVVALVAAVLLGILVMETGAAEQKSRDVPGKAPAIKPKASYLGLSDEQLGPLDKAAGEVIGWLPADKSVSVFNPPSFLWPHEPKAGTIPRYTVQWAKSRDFSDAVTIGGLDLNAYTHNKTLEPGTYYWRYRYAAQSERSSLQDLSEPGYRESHLAKGEPSAWSYVRTVTVPATAIVFPKPSLEEIDRLIPKGHPRLLLRPEDLPRLRKLALGNGPEAVAFAKIRERADILIGRVKPPKSNIRVGELKGYVPDSWLGRVHFPKEPPAPKRKPGPWKDRMDTQYWLVDGEIMAFTYLITQDKQYAEGAERYLLEFCRWDPLHGASSLEWNDEVSLPLLYRLPRIYDWAYDALSPEAKEKFLEHIRIRAYDEYKGRQFRFGTGLLSSGGASHPNRAWHKLAEMAIATYRNLPESQPYLNCALEKFYAIYPVWSDDDGGWHEGLTYWHQYMAKAVFWTVAAKSALGIDVLKKPYYLQIGDYPLYIAPPGTPDSGFGDLGFLAPKGGMGMLMNCYIRDVHREYPQGHSPYWLWWMQHWQIPLDSEDRDAPSGGIVPFLFAANLGPLPEAKTPVDMPPSKVFRGTGVAALHNTLLDANEDVEILFKSSPFGRKSHGHDPQNDFILDAYGESLLTHNDYRNGWHSKFHVNVVYNSSYHNTVGVNDEVQLRPPVDYDHDLPSLGKIVEFSLAKDLDYVASDAVGAWNGDLTRALRKIAFAKPDVMVVYDDLAAPKPSTYQFYLHSLAPFKLDEGQNRLSTQRPKAGVDVQYLSTVPLAMTQTDGYDPKPEKLENGDPCPNQWHIKASTQQQRPELEMLMVAIPYKKGQQAAWTAERVESPTAIGVRVHRGGSNSLIAFRKAGVQGEATLEGLKFSTPVARQ